MIMEKNQQIWADKTNAIWVGVLLYAIGGLVYGVVAGIQSLTSTVGDIASFASGGSMGSSGGGFWSFLTYLTLAAVIVGYALFVIGLKNWRDILGDDDSRAVKKIYNGAILAAIAYVWLLVGFWGWIASVLNVISFILMLMGYMALKNSSTFPAKGRKGASNLFISMILSLIAGILVLVLGWIPLVGLVISAIAGIMSLIAFILIFVGWAQIKSANPEELLKA